jgi:hypothetical protein
MSVTVQKNPINFLSSKEASARSGYTSDYISRLAREGKVIAKRVGISWFVDAASLENFVMESERAREARKETLRLERFHERTLLHTHPATTAPASPVQNTLTTQTLTPRTHTLHDVVELNLADDAEAFAFAPFGHAHKHALAAVSVGVALAFMGALAPALPPVSPAQNSALSLGSFMDGVWSFALFSFPWRAEVAVLPEAGTDGIQQPTQRHGIVVLPGDASEKTIQDVKDTFSDDVLVSVDEDNTGTIVPVFQDGAGDAYRFVIVPVGSSP